MALILADRVRETTTSTGTGDITLAGALTGFQTFSAAIGNGNTTYYVIAGQGTSEWEVGIGTYASAGNTLARTTVLASSNGGSLVNFSAGTKDTWVDYAAGKAVTTDTLAYPPAIGGTTPAAGTFTNLRLNTNLSLNGYTGTSGQVLTSSGSGLPTWTTPTTGTVTSVGGTGTVSGLSLSGTVTASGNLTLGGTLAVTASNFASQTANTVLAAPNGGAGTPTFRTLVAADIPTLNQNTTGSAAKWTTARTLSFTGDVTGSGSVDGSANVATGLTLASGSVTQAKLASNVAGNGPAFYGYNNTNQTAPTVSTWTKCDLNSELFDTNSNFASSRFTPTVAGYYQVNATVVFSTAQIGLCTAGIYKNGNVYQQGPTQASATVYNLSFAALIYLNGSTDYIELYVYCSNTSTIAGGAASTTLAGALVRAA